MLRQKVERNSVEGADCDALERGKKKEGVKNGCLGTSLVIQWLRHHTPDTEGPVLIPSQGTRSHMPWLRPGAAKLIN